MCSPKIFAFVLFGGGNFVFALIKHFEVQKQRGRSRDTHIRGANSKSEAERDSGSTHRLMTFVCVIKKETGELKREKTVTLNVLSFASGLIPILFSSFHFCPFIFSPLCQLSPVHHVLDVNNLSYNFFTWLLLVYTAS